MAASAGIMGAESVLLTHGLPRSEAIRGRFSLGTGSNPAKLASKFWVTDDHAAEQKTSQISISPGE